MFLSLSYTIMKQVVRCYVFNQENEILLVKHRPDTKWTLPGGHVEEWETIDKTLQREMKEEFGIDVEPFGYENDLQSDNVIEHVLPIALYEVFYTNDEGQQHKMEFVYFADLLTPITKVDANEIHEYKFFSIDEVMLMDVKRDIHPHIIEILEANLELLEE